MSGAGAEVAGFAPEITAELADVLRLDVEAFIDVYGAGWTWVEGETWHDYDADPSGGLGHELTRWAISGSPPQVMAHVFHHGAYLSAPRGIWSQGTHGLVYQPEGHTYVAVDEPERAHEVVRGIVARRRRSFRYCHYCRTSTPPELRISTDTCMGCASTWEGVVY